MVTNAELAKEVDEQKKLLEEKTRIRDEAIEEMEYVAQEKEDEYLTKGKGNADLEDEIPELDPPLGEEEPFINPQAIWRKDPR